MCLRDLISELRRNGVVVSESSIRWAIKTEKVSRPHLDGSLRFNFQNENVVELIEHFGEQREPTQCP